MSENNENRGLNSYEDAKAWSQAGVVTLLSVTSLLWFSGVISPATEPFLVVFLSSLTVMMGLEMGAYYLLIRLKENYTKSIWNAFMGEDEVEKKTLISTVFFYIAVATALGWACSDIVQAPYLEKHWREHGVTAIGSTID